MSVWQIRQSLGESQVSSVEELQKRASNGELEADALVLQPNTSEWVYAFEMNELSSSFSLMDDDLTSKNSNTGLNILSGILLIAGLTIGYNAFQTHLSLPDYDDLTFTGEGGLSAEQAMTPNSIRVYAGPKDSPQGMQEVGKLPKRTIVSLLDREGDRYLVDAPSGKGWVSVQDAVPAYLFMEKSIRDEKEAYFYPERRIQLIQQSWEKPEYKSHWSNFRFRIQNLSRIPIQDIVVVVTLKDENGRELQKILFPIEGELAGSETISIGSFVPEGRVKDRASRSKKVRNKSYHIGEYQLMTTQKYDDMIAQNSKMADRWIDSIEINLGELPYKEASFAIESARAVR
jgi:hypothetical protein